MPIPKSVIARVMGLPLVESRYWIIWALLGKRRKENRNEHYQLGKSSQESNPTLLG